MTPPDPFVPAAFPDHPVPAIGFGTWRMGERDAARQDEVAALRRAMERGFTHFDTAEMYAEGGAERVLGEAIADVDRDTLFLTGKVYPWNASADGMVEACTESLRRVGTDYFDLYLLHWPGNADMEEVLDGSERLLSEGKIKSFGVSNFSADALRDLDDRGMLDRIAANQVLHNIGERGPEYDLFPHMQEKGVVGIAYTPLEPDVLAGIEGMEAVAADAGLSLPGLALAWHLTLGLACPIPKSATLAHIDELADAADVRLDAEVMQRIDDLAPPPDHDVPLQTR